jgi:lipopolysaccharide export system permease protein
VLLGLDTVLAVVSEMSDVGKGDYTFAKAVVDILLTVPYPRLQPVSDRGGDRHAHGVEASWRRVPNCTALRALGLSRRRLGLAVAIALSVLTALMVLNGETLSPLGPAP